MNGTCPECANDSYCGCSTNFQCQCYNGYTGESGSCEGKTIVKSYSTYLYTDDTYMCVPITIQILMSVKTTVRVVMIGEAVYVLTLLEAMTVSVRKATSHVTTHMNAHVS